MRERRRGGARVPLPGGIPGRSGRRPGALAALAVLLLLAAATGCGGEGGSAFAAGERSDGEPAGASEPGATGSRIPAVVGADTFPDRFGFGRAPRPGEIARWDVDVGPEGAGLPPGSGTVSEGARVYREKCSACHGPTGADGPFDVLVAAEPTDAFPFGRDPGLVTAIGNYWPYATTVFDYVRRSMPWDDPGSLTDDEVYAVTAWLLWRNGRIDEGAVMSRETLPRVEMPARRHFVPSDDVEMDGMPEPPGGR